MAPALTEALPVTPTQSKLFTYEDPDPKIFPDGIKTSGQTPPDFDKLKPYEEFPKEITGPTAWSAGDFESRPEQWTHRFSAHEIAELSEAADSFMASNTPLTGITKAKFPLPNLESYLGGVRNEILNGQGFVLFKGFPVDEWGTHKSAVAYMGLGTYLGYFVSQNGKGHVLGHVKDLGDDPTETDKTRIYRTTARQYFHADDCDIVGLLCIARALSGGESDLVSSNTVFNTLQREHPAVARLLCEPIWYWDRKGEVSAGQDPYMRQPVFYLETGTDHHNPRVYCKWDPYYITSLARFSDAGVIPPLSDAQKHAAAVLEATCRRLALHMVLAVGDIQFVSNAQVLHSRTAYTDAGPPAPRRHLMRLWLATPEGEGGWRLPFADSRHAKRGGVQVDDVAPAAPTDAE